MNFVVDTLVKEGHTYEKEGALWLKTTDFGDDKDRVMKKSDGGFTYFVPDVAYHLDKWTRGFKRVINEQGADHHSTISRVRAVAQWDWRKQIRFVLFSPVRFDFYRRVLFPQ